MDETLKCFVCHMKTDDWRNELDGLKSQHSSTFITDFIKTILGDFETKRNVDDRSNCICVECLNRFEEYDWTCTMAKQYEKELYELLVHTESLCFAEKSNDEPASNTEPSIGQPHLDPLTGFVEVSFRNGDDDLLNVMAEPLLIPKENPFDEEDLALHCVPIDNTDDDSDFKTEPESNHGEDDVEYSPPKRAVKAKKTEAGAIRMENSEVPALAAASAPKKRGRPRKRDRPEDDENSHKKREKKTYECKNCDKVFDKCVELLSHEKWHRKQLIPEFRCSKCYYISENQEAFAAHEKLHENTPLLQCVFCDMTFTFKGSLTKHTRLIHKQGAELRNEPAIYRCDICNFDTLKNEDELAIHKEMHIGLSPLQCVVCKIEFREKKNIRPHMRLHTGQKKYEYQCERCGQEFRYKRSFMLHMAKYDGIRNENCPHCPRKFTAKSDLERHLRTHTLEKPYTCGMCGKRFARRDNMRLHQKTHEEQKKEEKAYSCLQCDASFARLSKLHKHMEKHGIISFARDIRIINELNENRL